MHEVKKKGGDRYKKLFRTKISWCHNELDVNSRKIYFTEITMSLKQDIFTEEFKGGGIRKR